MTRNTITTVRTKENLTFGDYLPKMYTESVGADLALNNGDWNNAARCVGRMCIIIEKYRGKAGNSQAAFLTYDHIVGDLVGKLIAIA